MNKVIASTGLLILGASTGLQAQTSGQSYNDSADFKPWSIGAVVRGFYDDNSLNTSSNEIESFGIEAGPSLAYDATFNQGTTSLVANYDYRYRWFENSARSEDDQYHILGIAADHKFSDTLSASISDTLVITDEPTILDNNVITAIRLRQDALRNTFNVRGESKISETLSAGLGYSNRFYDYENDVFSSLLDRTEHLVTLDGRKVLNPETTAVLGYQFGVTSFGNNTISRAALGLPDISSETRDSRSHYLFVGADHAFNPNLYGSIRAGAQFVDYVNAIGGDTSTTSPYVDASLSYNFSESGSSMLGVRHARNATDVSGTTTAPVLDQETTTIYGMFQYNFTPYITGKLNGQAQFSEFNGGSFSDVSESLYLIGASIGYRVHPNTLVELGYSYTDLVSEDISGRAFQRNIAYLGVTATY